MFRLIRRRVSPPPANLRSQAPLRLHSTEASPTATPGSNRHPPQRAPNHHATFPPQTVPSVTFCSATASVNAFVRASLRRFPTLSLHSPRLHSQTALVTTRFQLRAGVNRHSAMPSKPEAAWVPTLLRTMSDYAEYCVVFLAVLRHNRHCACQCPCRLGQHGPALSRSSFASFVPHSGPTVS